MSFFAGRKLLIVTKHGKEAVIAPVLEKVLDVQCLVATDFDTDKLGTFSGEVRRKRDVLETLREKCRQGLAMYQLDLAVASEGSFGMHPTVFIAPADDELVMLLDLRNGIEIVSRELSLDTNFNGAQISNEADFLSFLETVKFPSHGIIIRKAASALEGMEKGIVAMDVALAVFRKFLAAFGSAYVETDMRACYNPSRMLVIEKAVNKLVARASTLCPDCGIPGFGAIDAVAGLRCSFCGSPTKSILYVLDGCQKCGFTERRYHPRGVTVEDPAYCDHCNP
ncbi:DUF6671 family protein [Flavobacterium sp.]|uniref:DUF6671 family protein n=1 Tax=Flavobacterium sp. TaxID=239 RepID=UPI002624312E|nr:DUF6671 family protein [Flavobacterium sp.]